MRDYLGGIYGGNGTDPLCATLCQWGTYAFVPNTPLPFNAPGASVQFTFNVSNTKLAMSNAILGKIHTVPDPYYVTSAYDIAVNSKDIQFTNVPAGSLIRIYTASGVLIRVLQNTSTTNTFTGRMTIVNYASTVQ